MPVTASMKTRSDSWCRCLPGCEISDNTFLRVQRIAGSNRAQMANLHAVQAQLQGHRAADEHAAGVQPGGEVARLLRHLLESISHANQLKFCDQTVAQMVDSS